MVTEDELKNMSPQEIEDMQKKNCIFCHIVSGKVPSKKVFEDDKVLAILDINPASPGHVLLLPKEHFVIMPQMPQDLTSHMMLTAKNISKALLKEQAQGTNILIANGAAAGQKAPHFMMHIIPRNEGDGLNFTMPGIQVSKEDMEQTMKTISDHLQGKPKAEAQTTKEPEKPGDINMDDLKKVIDNGM